MDLDVWLTKIRQTRSHAEVFAILDEFRTHDWADDQRSKMAKLYIRMLDNFGPISNDEPLITDGKDISADKKKDSSESKQKAGQNDGKGDSMIVDPASVAAAQDEVVPITTGSTPVNDGPVWYEKM